MSGRSYYVGTNENKVRRADLSQPGSRILTYLIENGAATTKAIEQALSMKYNVVRRYLEEMQDYGYVEKALLRGSWYFSTTKLGLQRIGEGT